MKVAGPTRERISNARILVVGDVMLDKYWHGEVTRISPEAPVPVVHINNEVNRLGGAANVALNVKSLGAQVTLLSVVGADEPANVLKSLLDKSEIGYHLGQDMEMETIVKLRVIGRTQQMLRIDFEKEPLHEVLSGLMQKFIEQIAVHDAVIFSDYGKGGLAHIPSMIAIANQASKPVLIDPKGADYSRYSGASLITPNRAELSLVVGAWKNESQLAEKAEKLRRSLGIDSLLLTRSEEGMTLFDSHGQISVNAHAREVNDVTGAGDTVIATMGVMISTGLSVRDAMMIANLAGSISVGKFGASSVSYGELFL